MKIHEHEHAELPGRGRLRTLLASLAACLLAALPVLADGEGDGGADGRNNAPDPGENFAAGGDETVGTLPVIGGGRIDLPFTRGWRGIEPAFYLEGTPENLAITIQGARGRGFVSCDVLDSQTGRVRLVFHGDVFVTLDRDLASTLPIAFGVAVPASFGAGRASVALGGGRFRNVRLLPGLLPLPVASMSAGGALDRSPIRIRAVNGIGIHSAHTVAATADLLILGQTY